jgi:predicted DNA repair protein MutK
MTTYTDLTQRANDIIGDVAAMGIHASDDTLGVVIRQALMDDPSATAQDVADIWAEATADAAADRE